jgi:hypothetical protein
VTYGAVGAQPADGAAGPPSRRDDLGRIGIALLVAGSIFTLLAAVSLWSWRTFANSEGFADVATDTLKEPAVTEAIADQIVNVLQDQVATAQAAAAVRPVLRQVAAEVVASAPFRGLFHAGVREMHAAVVEGHRTGVRVEVADAGQLVRDALAVVNPNMAEAIPDSALTAWVGVYQSRWADLFMRGADLAGWLILPLSAAAVACFVGAVRRTTNRRRALEVVGVCLIAVGAVVFAVLAALLNVVADVGQDPRQRTALRALFWSVMHVLNVTGKVLIVLGAVIALAATLAGRGPLQDRLAQLADSARATLARPGPKAAAAVAAIGLGLLGLVWPLVMAEFIVRVGASGLIVLGAVWVFDLIGASSWVADRPPGPSRVTPRRLALGGTTGVATFSLVLLLGGLSFVRAVRAPGLDRLGINDAGCNEHVALCDRRVDEVAFAGTHNAMSAAGEKGWTFTRQSGGLGAQLYRGVRAFLLDLHYGGQIKDLVRTALLSQSQQELAKAELTPKERQAVAGLFGLAGAEIPREDQRVYLCHIYCELGATLAETAFRQLHDFLRVNPNEVVILILEDFVTAEDAIDVLKSSGLADRAYTWTAGAPAPTLRQLIEHKKNVVVMAEHNGGATPSSPWYLSAYNSLLQDTQFKFGSMDELMAPGSCALLRGHKDAPLLLLNHWLDTGPPTPNDGIKVNVASVLEKRADSCRRARRHIPNIVAVDFYAKGDLFKVIDRLNHVEVNSAVLATAGP